GGRAPARGWRRWSPRSAGRIEPARLVEVEIVGAQPTEAVAQEVLHRRRAAVEADEPPVRAPLRAELDREEDAVATALEGAADQHLVVAHAVEVARVEQGDAAVDGLLDGRAALRLVGRAGDVGRPPGADPASPA